MGIFKLLNSKIYHSVVKKSCERGKKTDTIYQGKSEIFSSVIK